jgi:antitoxin (DNA-binding transcriptional repressor) of toxin-antitoxin stability system
MQTLTAKDAKYGFGRLIDLARAAPVAVAKHGRAVVIVMAIEEYERLKALDGRAHPSTKPPRAPRGRRRMAAR